MTTLEQIGGWADIPVEVEAEIDRKLMTVRQVLQLDAGSIVRLSRSAGDTINVLVGGAPFGSGEIVMLENTMGVRITELTGEE
jgi:flagellar motor switch protein FliN/FliY